MNITCREEVTGQLTDPGDSMTLRVFRVMEIAKSERKKKNKKNESKVEGKGREGKAAAAAPRRMSKYSFANCLCVSVPGLC